MELIAEKATFQDWDSFKSFLIESGSLSSYFNTSIDSRISEWEDSQRKRELGPDSAAVAYDPMQVDILLNKVSELVDRILSYRRELRELEVSAVKAAADYQLFVAQSEAEIQLELSTLRTSIKSQAKVHQEEAAAAFGDEQAMNRGMQKLSASQALQLKMEVSSCTDDEVKIKQKWAALSSYHKAYQVRHSTDDNAHNYAQRAERLMALLLEDIAEAHARAAAAAIGIKLVHVREPASLPAKNEIDKFLLWCRKEIRLFNRDIEREIQYEMTIPLAGC